MKYDIIGDIHGHADKLELLLLKLGYKMVDGIYQQIDHQTVFIGDLIDRGKQNRRTVEIVQNMVKYGDAHAIMGNHEYNAICYHTQKEGSETRYLRPHTHGKFNQHQEFLKEYPLGHHDTKEVIDWFKELPLYLEFDNFRIVHACWDEIAISELSPYLGPNNTLQNTHWAESADETTPLFNIIERLLKGEEAKLPDETFFLDKDGNRRDSIRIKWWGNKSGFCKDLAFGYDFKTIKNFPHVKPNVPSNSPSYTKKNKPVFFGHYWQEGKPVLQQENLCCVDYSAGRGGDLVCYSLDNPSDTLKLNENNLTWC